ncbi:MAG TPA: hypothetical protein VK941_14060 [Gillisia sp.]|nr:hypothetical protein [Gillisia sp.]
MTTQISVSRRSIQVLRILLSGIFLIASTSHLLNVEQTVNRIDQASFKGFAYFFGNPELLVILSGIAMLVAGLAFQWVQNQMGSSSATCSSHTYNPYRSGRANKFSWTII